MQSPRQIKPALAVLLEATYNAKQTSSNYWKFAVEHDQFTALGLTRIIHFHGVGKGKGKGVTWKQTKTKRNLANIDFRFSLQLL